MSRSRITRARARQPTKWVRQRMKFQLNFHVSHAIFISLPWEGSYSITRRGAVSNGYESWRSCWVRTSNTAYISERNHPRTNRIIIKVAQFHPTKIPADFSFNESTSSEKSRTTLSSELSLSSMRERFCGKVLCRSTYHDDGCVGSREKKLNHALSQWLNVQGGSFGFDGGTWTIGIFCDWIYAAHPFSLRDTRSSLSLIRPHTSHSIWDLRTLNDTLKSWITHDTAYSWACLCLCCVVHSRDFKLMEGKHYSSSQRRTTHETDEKKKKKSRVLQGSSVTWDKVVLSHLHHRIQLPSFSVFMTVTSPLFSLSQAQKQSAFTLVLLRHKRCDYNFFCAVRARAAKSLNKNL